MHPQLQTDSNWRARGVNAQIDGSVFMRAFGHTHSGSFSQKRLCLSLQESVIDELLLGKQSSACEGLAWKC